MSSVARGRDSARPSSRASLLIISCLFCLTRQAAFAADDHRARDSAHDYDPPIPGSYTLPVVKRAGDGSLLDADGTALQLRDLMRGRVTVLSFIYTRCAAAKACPYATGVLDELHLLSAEDKTLAANMRLVSMSFDPEHDTPERLSAYSQWARARKGGSDWRFATAKSRADLQPILEAYNQTVDQRANAADPQGPLYHILRVYLIDPEGRIRNIYSSDTLDARLVMADVKTLILETTRISSQ